MLKNKFQDKILNRACELLKRTCWKIVTLSFVLESRTKWVSVLASHAFVQFLSLKTNNQVTNRNLRPNIHLRFGRPNLHNSSSNYSSFIEIEVQCLEDYSKTSNLPLYNMKNKVTKKLSPFFSEEWYKYCKRYNSFLSRNNENGNLLYPRVLHTEISLNFIAFCFFLLYMQLNMSFYKSKQTFR